MGACMSSQNSTTKNSELKIDLPPKSSHTEACINPVNSISTNPQKTQKILDNELKTIPYVMPQIKVPQTNVVQQYSIDELAKRYRQTLKQQVIGYVNDLPNSLFRQGSTAAQSAKSIRLSKQITKFPQFLPCQHTNSIFVRVDQTRSDSMNILISGSKGTPYANGLYHFELYCDDSFPSLPPKMQILTGKDKVRFNPNLYQGGYICLSLLGTWPGSANQNWNPASSTLLQVFVSIQSLIMTQDIYFNEPGFESMKNTQNGRLCNEGYSNVVRLANIRYAMIEILKKPPKGFEKVVNMHFLIKRNQILEECNKWLLQKDRPYRNCSQNIQYQNIIAQNGYANLLLKEVNELRDILMALKQQ